MKRLRVLVVGVGFIGKLHARVVQELPRAVLCGVVDINAKTGRTVGDLHQVPAFTDVTDAVNRTSPDAAIIATPDSFHREPAAACMAAGASVLIEKPLATTVADAERIVKTAETQGVRLMTGHLGRFHTRHAQLADTIRSGALGRPVIVTTSTWGPKSLGARVASTTNPLWHFAIHDIDTMLWMTGATLASVDGSQFIASKSGAMAFGATGTLSTGASFHICAGWTLPDSAEPKFDIKVHCEEGVAQASWNTDGVTVYTPDTVDDIDCLAWPSLNGHIAGALEQEIRHFVDCLLDDIPFVITPNDALNAVRAAGAIQEASVLRELG